MPALLAKPAPPLRLSGRTGLSSRHNPKVML